MRAGSAGSSIQVSVSVDKVSQGHCLTARMLHKLELFLHEIKDCAELCLSFFVEHGGSWGVSHRLSGLS